MELLQGYDASDYLSRCQQFETNRYLPMDILVKVDRMTMAHSLESRPPFLDHELVEFAASLPSHLKFRPPNRKKIVLQDVARRHVPRHLVERKKAGFAVPLQAWFAGPLLPMFEDLGLNHGKVAEDLSLWEIRKLVAENKAGRRDHGLKLWSILVLEVWLRRILDCVKSEAVGMTC